MKLKNVIKHFFATLIALMVAYLGMSFLSWNFNPGTWTEGSRAVTLFMVVVSTVALNVVSYHLVEV